MLIVVLLVAGVVAALWIIGRSAVSSQINEVGVAVRNQLRVSFLLRFGEFGDEHINPNVWEDHYLLGYAHGAVSAVTKMFAGDLRVEQRGQIFIDVLRMEGVSFPERIVQRIVSLLHGGDPEFLVGTQRGSTVAILMANRASPELLLQEDVQEALADSDAISRSVGGIFPESDVTPQQAAAMSLSHRYLDSHVLCSW